MSECSLLKLVEAQNSNLNANVYSYGLKVSFVSRCYDSDFKRRGKPQLVFMKRRIIKLSSWERNLI